MTTEKVFIDTSAFYALMDRSDSYHQSASKLWAHMLDKGYYLKTSNYVTVETLALLQNRLGFEAADDQLKYYMEEGQEERPFCLCRVKFP